MRNLLRRLLNGTPVPANKGRDRPGFNEWPSAVYAVGDVHGCYDQLVQLEAMIVSDAQELSGDKWIVMLGDYIDRGPESAAVLDRLCAPAPKGFRRICLAGNHEEMLLEFMANPVLSADWLRFGGRETLASYGIDADRFLDLPERLRVQALESHIPSDHLELLASLPVCLSLPGTVFVHAGLRPGVPLERQSDADMMWIREPFLGSQSTEPVLVVHGHTPAPEPEIRPNRIGIDTGAFATGRLTAVRLSEHAPPAYLSTT